MARKSIMEYNKTGKLSNGAVVGHLGARVYLVGQYGIPKSPGFHELEATEEGYIGDVGALRYFLDKKGRVLRAEGPTGNTIPEEEIARYVNENIEHISHSAMYGVISIMVDHQFGKKRGKSEAVK